MYPIYIPYRTRTDCNFREPGVSWLAPRRASDGCTQQTRAAARVIPAWAGRRRELVYANASLPQLRALVLKPTSDTSSDSEEFTSSSSSSEPERVERARPSRAHARHEDDDDDEDDDDVEQERVEGENAIEGEFECVLPCPGLRSLTSSPSSRLVSSINNVQGITDHDALNNIWETGVREEVEGDESAAAAADRDLDIKDELRKATGIGKRKGAAVCSTSIVCARYSRSCSVGGAASQFSRSKSSRFSATLLRRMSRISWSARSKFCRRS